MSVERAKLEESCGNKICRICLSLTELLLPIFEGEGLEQDLDVKIRKYLPVKISVSDSLPQQMCFHCANALVSWDSFITICLESERKLKYFLGMSNEGEAEAEEATAREEKTEENQARRCSPRRSKRRLLPADEGEDDGEDGEEEEEGEEGEESSTSSPAPEIKTEAFESGSGEADGSGLACEHCGKSYKGKRYLARHVKLAHKESKSMEAQKCDLCPNVYKTRANLERHYAKEHVNNQVECPACHASVHAKKLDSHLKTVHGVKTDNDNEERFKCKFCDKWFKNKYVRNAHVKEIHLSEPMKCKLCDFQGVRAVLRRHKTEVHAEKRFPCSLCNSAFKTLHTLKMHMTSHSDLRSFTCDICGRGFKRLNNVRDHMKCHEQKSNQCQICGNFFARKRYLAIHEKTIHNFYADGVIPEEKGFECGICGAKLKWKKNLLAHMRIHTGEKPYVCKICKKNFVCHGSLRTHMSKHGVCATKESNAASAASEVAQQTQTANHSLGGIGLFTHFALQ